MWEAIGLVTSGIALLAFIAAVAALIHRNAILSDERRIRLAPEGERARLVARHLEFFEVDTARLEPEQAAEIVFRQIDARARRFLVTAAVVALIFVTTAGVAVYSIARQAEPTHRDDPPPTGSGPPSPPQPPASSERAVAEIAARPDLALAEPESESPSPFATVASLVREARRSNAPDEACRRFQRARDQLTPELLSRLDASLLRRADSSYVDARSPEDFTAASQLYDSAFQKLFPS